MKLERLPVPVRYRAAKAVDACEDVFRLAGSEGKRFRPILSDPTVSTLRVINEFAQFVEPRASRNFGQTVTTRSLAAQNSIGMMWLSFWARSGALYEPTRALRKLLEFTDIADNVPVRMLRPPVVAMCISTDVAGWNHAGGVEAIPVFEHRPTSANSTADVSLNLTAWFHDDGDAGKTWGMKTLSIDLDNPEESLIETCQEAIAKPPIISGTVSRDRFGFWRPILDYVVKVLLYLASEKSQVELDAAYTNAPKTFPGFGKRKREERLGTIETLYDRYLIGPPELAQGPGTSGATEDTGGGVDVHWRRGHFRMQPHGPRNTLRCVTFIMPTLVRSDLLP